MIYCKFCGSKLKGVKKFCIACGKVQEKTKSDKTQITTERGKKQIKDLDEGNCIKCNEDTEKKCYFCSQFVCREHSTRLQANTNPYIKMQQYLAENETKRINEGWRGFMVISCPKCTSLRVGKQLSDDETNSMNTVDICSWYKLEPQMR